jgi:hypothetical protein
LRRRTLPHAAPERTARARVNGQRYDAARGDLGARDQYLAAQAQERAWIWNHDAGLAARIHCCRALTGARPCQDLVNEEAA